jgi:hypothetical protein
MAEAMHAILLELPAPLYRRAQRVAKTKHRPVQEVLLEVVAHGLPQEEPLEREPTDSALPLELVKELAAMERLSEAELWQIGREVMPANLRRRFRALQAKNAARTLSPREQQRLQELLYESERINLRKAQAYALLAKRGVKLPAVEELPIPR